MDYKTELNLRHFQQVACLASVNFRLNAARAVSVGEYMYILSRDVKGLYIVVVLHEGHIERVCQHPWSYVSKRAFSSLMCHTRERAGMWRASYLER